MKPGTYRRKSDGTLYKLLPGIGVACQYPFELRGMTYPGTWHASYDEMADAFELVELDTPETPHPETARERWVREKNEEWANVHPS